MCQSHGGFIQFSPGATKIMVVQVNFLLEIPSDMAPNVRTDWFSSTTLDLFVPRY